MMDLDDQIEKDPNNYNLYNKRGTDKICLIFLIPIIYKIIYQDY